MPTDQNWAPQQPVKQIALNSNEKTPKKMMGLKFYFVKDLDVWLH